jgi:2-oxoglutarate dehydrogenase E2 component (dihydrolipoamide succinyltransferase)
MTNIVVPELGESVVEARVAKWLKKEGDQVQMGDPLVELETEKIDLEVSADRPGVLKSIKHQEGDDVKVGEVLAELEPGAAAAARPAAESQPSAAKAPAQAQKPAPPGESTSSRERPAGDSKSDREPAAVSREPAAVSREPAPANAEVRATPTARNGAREAGVLLESIAASGFSGRVMKDDVLKAKAPSAPAGAKPVAARAPAGARSEERIRMSKRRATIARRLVEAQSTAAMLTTFNEVDMSAVMALRERHKQAFKDRHGVGLGIASFFVKASIGALRAFPRINAEIQGDEMVLKHYYDIGVAVGASEGLVVPVLRDADRSSFAEVEKQIRDFAKRAEDGTLSLADLKGGTFTITNGGVFGSLLSTPILNPPQVGILGLHKIQERPMAVNGQVSVKPMMYVALTYDHRIVDGAEAVRFLVRVKELVEDPGALLLD